MAPNINTKRSSKRPIKTTVDKAQRNWQAFLANIEKKQTRYVFSDSADNIIAAMISEDTYNFLLKHEKITRKVVKDCMLLSPKKLKEWLAVDNTPVQVDFSLEQYTLKEIIDDVQENRMRYMIMNSVGTPAVIIVDGQTYKTLLSYEKLAIALAKVYAQCARDRIL